MNCKTISKKMTYEEEIEYFATELMGMYQLLDTIDDHEQQKEYFDRICTEIKYFVEDVKNN